MKSLIEQFGQHIEDALQNLESSSFKKPPLPIHNVLISGLGGSGIGGTIVSELVQGVSPVPITVIKDYNIPAFVNENTLVIACSYSGNTEETLWATREALSHHAEVCCITSGGRLKELASSKGLNMLNMQGGNPPRSMFAFAFAYLAYILEFYGLAELGVAKQLRDSAKLLADKTETIKSEAETIAQKLQGKIPVLYAVSGQTGIASRWRQQLNENAKMLAWEATIPEMNHNELVGWEGGSSQFAAVFLRNKTDFERNQKRIEIIKEIIRQKTDTVLEVWSQGEDILPRAFYLIHLGDWVSYYLSELNQVDIIDIRSIDHLKTELSKVPL